ncbi:MAG: peptide/nickel transport system permease protein [Frankiales bacterium]|jgi:ABC-type dipeptide/oligopeptide/nickel transport system permease subunit|nr:peptide/nickel transport system permease protein [Frankiales bacterium]
MTTATTGIIGVPDVALAPTPLRRLLARFRGNWSAMFGLSWLLLVVLVAIAAPLVAPQNPATINPSHINAGPSLAHLLGTDSVGRDVLSRLIYSARVSMRVAALVVLLAGVVALPVGLIAGYFGRWVDGILMRVMDALFAFPPLMLALAIAALLGPSVLNVSIAVAIPFIPGFARLVRAEVLSVREELYVEAARSVGVGSARMLRRHILPNVVSPFIVQAALAFGYAILAEAGLSFLGFGVQPPNASWGVMLQNAYNFVTEEPWPMIPPGLAIAITVLAFNLVGDGLRDALGREVFVVKS